MTVVLDSSVTMNTRELLSVHEIVVILNTLVPAYNKHPDKTSRLLSIKIIDINVKKFGYNEHTATTSSKQYPVWLAYQSVNVRLLASFTSHLLFMTNSGRLFFVSLFFRLRQFSVYYRPHSKDGEGNSFSLFVSSHPGGYPISIP